MLKCVCEKLRLIHGDFEIIFFGLRQGWPHWSPINRNLKDDVLLVCVEVTLVALSNTLHVRECAEKKLRVCDQRSAIWCY